MEENKFEKKSRPGWLIGAALVALGVIFMAGQFFNSISEEIIGTVILGGFGLTFLAVYLQDKRHWWALIPAYFFGFIAGMVFLGAFFGESVMSLMPVGFALPFYYVYSRDNEKNKWALIPAYVFSAVAFIVLMGVVFGGRMVGVLVMALMAAPFLYVYMNDRKHWWALIPGGIFATIAAGIAISGLLWVIPVLMIAGGAYILFAARSSNASAPQQPAYTERPPQKKVPVAEFTPITTKNNEPVSDTVTAEKPLV